MNDELKPQGSDNTPVKVAYQQPSGILLLADITIFISMLSECFAIAQRKIRLARIQKLLGWEYWIEHYKDRISGKRVLSEQKTFEFPHELVTAKSLTKVGFDVLFAPKGLFKPSEKTFDVFLVKNHIILKADLKSISSKNPDTIANRIKKGGDQAPRVVIDILSDIERKTLIIGLRSGIYKNKNLKEILLFYRNQFYVLPKSLVESNSLYKVIK